MKILAFLQNTWVRDPARFHQQLAVSLHPEQFRRRVLTYALFAGCLTGRRLQAELGDDLCKSIVWEEASREITATASAIVKPDFAHIRAILTLEQPSLVIAFGRVAVDALCRTDAWPDHRRVPVVRSPHPAARNPLDLADFRAAMLQVKATNGLGARRAKAADAKNRQGAA